MGSDEGTGAPAPAFSRSSITSAQLACAAWHKHPEQAAPQLRIVAYGRWAVTLLLYQLLHCFFLHARAGIVRDENATSKLYMSRNVLIGTKDAQTDL